MFVPHPLFLMFCYFLCLPTLLYISRRAAKEQAKGLQTTQIIRRQLKQQTSLVSLLSRSALLLRRSPPQALMPHGKVTIPAEFVCGLPMVQQGL